MKTETPSKFDQTADDQTSFGQKLCIIGFERTRSNIITVLFCLQAILHVFLS